MSTVFFKSIDSYKKTAEISEGAKQLLNRIWEVDNMKPAKYVPLKVHFGEKGNRTYISPENYAGVIELLKSNKVKSAYIETNAIYRGERNNRTAHLHGRRAGARVHRGKRPQRG